MINLFQDEFISIIPKTHVLF